jgi:hypothetical protein
MKDLLDSVIVVDVPNRTSGEEPARYSEKFFPLAEAIATASLQNSFLGVNVAK